MSRMDTKFREHRAKLRAGCISDSAVWGEFSSHLHARVARLGQQFNAEYLHPSANVLARRTRYAPGSRLSAFWYGVAVMAETYYELDEGKKPTGICCEYFEGANLVPAQDGGAA